MRKKFCSVSTESFTLLVHLIGPHVRKNLNLRTAVSVEERLLITLKQGQFIHLLRNLYRCTKNIHISQNYFFKHAASLTNANYMRKVEFTCSLFHSTVSY